MYFYARQPIPALAGWIDKLWICEDYLPSHRLEQKLPDAALAWIINLKEDRFRLFEGNRFDRSIHLPGSIIAGPRSTYFYLETESQESCLGIQFKPGGARPFLGDLIGELKDVDIALRDGLGRHAHVDDLRERLLETSSAERRLQLVERYLQRRLEKPIRTPAGHPAVAYALRMFERAPAAAPSVAQIADMANLSKERFIRVFKGEVGLTPKNYGNIVRFRLALRMIREGRLPPGIDLALSCGYYDQSHLNREFRKYANRTPTELLRRQDRFESHLPLTELPSGNKRAD
ncbi:helix-turn-helix domain-containing protein [Cohnella hongkongensis]|uniref:Helix-turn-helix domain-containing protein n=1 Tax=Cohnella hongkongensis TaxID=178337 RepID=A0ABV9FAB4_9BACL